MKTIISILTLMLIINVAFAGDNNSKANDALILKMSAKVESAKDGDWKTLAKCAKTLLDQSINYDETFNWIEKSIAVNKNCYNLAIMGDYYKMNNNLDEAYRYYNSAILNAQQEKRNVMIPEIQGKLLQVIGALSLNNNTEVN